MAFPVALLFLFFFIFFSQSPVLHKGVRKSGMAAGPAPLCCPKSLPISWCQLRRARPQILPEQGVSLPLIQPGGCGIITAKRLLYRHAQAIRAVWRSGQDAQLYHSLGSWYNNRKVVIIPLWPRRQAPQWPIIPFAVRRQGGRLPYHRLYRSALNESLLPLQPPGEGYILISWAASAFKGHYSILLRGYVII